MCKEKVILITDAVRNMEVEAYGSDIADAVLFPASDAAAKITGTDILVDAGHMSQLNPADCDV